MRSSISSSEPAGGRGWVLTLLGTFFGGAGLLYAVLILVDPYDTGRFVTLAPPGVSDTNLRTADASRGRDPRFDSAIFGSSTGQSLDPETLSAATGLRFVQLSITQAGPREILALLGYFRSRHKRAGAVVVSADVEWCSSDPALGARYPFPFWLYGGDRDYLLHVLNWVTLDRVAWRIGLWLGQRTANAPAGYFPYAPPDGSAGFRPLPPSLPALGPIGAGFPWIDKLRAEVATLDAATAVVILMPPVEQAFLPAAGSEAAARIASCRAALAQVVAGRARSGLIDDRVASAIASDRSKFFDRIHYKPVVARQIEPQIIAVLTGAEGGRSAGLVAEGAR